ncbi:MULTISPECIES: lactonase family protein [Rhizobium]|uniref:6-phosphogluconolactonase (Cycloisomerase 2 family) n=1 Tax=Rhizobium paranaense TaxID=1650438 RepID=A0A7W9D4L8_9HYPH|nr:lactonase family protein [Rhizobium paranaense]MBB5577607.1 6-phosphogluconolactonase (cycloisomerase 2 family) [Rhizobium paranaense]
MAGEKTRIVYVGARTTKARNARGNGLNVYRLTQDLSWKHRQLLEMENPSFLAFDRTGHFLYAVHGDSDRVSAFSIDPASGHLTFLNEQSTKGRNPVHLSFDPSNQFLIVANHVTSSLAVLRRQDDGRLGPVENLTTVDGQIGPHRVEQPFAKPHQVEFDPSGNWIAVPDKGLDKILVFRLDRAFGKLIEVTSCQTREGAGPRHIAFHPEGRLAYVIHELDSTVAAYRFDPATGSIEPFQILSSLADSFTGNSRGAEIVVSADGRFVYASNRGSDTIAAFSVGEDGHMAPLGSWATAGRTPRFFAMLPEGRTLLVANEDTDTITACSIDKATGHLSPASSTLTVGSPVCIVFKDLDQT